MASALLLLWWPWSFRAALRRRDVTSRMVRIDGARDVYVACVLTASRHAGFVGAVGETKLVRLASLSAATGCEILAKLEYLK